MMTRVFVRGAAAGGLAVIGLSLVLLLALNAGLGRWAVEAFVNRAQPALHGAFRCARVTVTPALRVTLYGVSLPLRDAQQTRMLTIGRVLIDTPAWEMALRRRVAVVDPQHIQAILNMAIPEYNLVLSNVTMDIHLESPDLLHQLFEMLGSLH